jgi:hypothetical protein
MQQPGGTVADGLIGTVNVFVDPGSTAKRIPNRYSWIWPVAFLIIGHGVFAYLMKPYVFEMMETALAQRNLPADSIERARSLMHTTTEITTPLTPVIIVGLIALYAVLIKVIYSAMGKKTRFRDLFALTAACSLIGLLQYIATYIVIRAKGDPIETPEQLAPPFGFDMLFPGVHGTKFVLLNFFSIFEIWFIVVLVLGLAALTRSSKIQAFLASTPAWLLPLAFRVLGSLFQRASA